MDIADESREGDVILRNRGLTIFLSEDAGALLSHATLDYLEAEGFLIRRFLRSSFCN